MAGLAKVCELELMVVVDVERQEDEPMESEEYSEL
jgi:hypothetical protein